MSDRIHRNLHHFRIRRRFVDPCHWGCSGFAVLVGRWKLHQCSSDHHIDQNFQIHTNAAHPKYCRFEFYCHYRHNLTYQIHTTDAHLRNLHNFHYFLDFPHPNPRCHVEDKTHRWNHWTHTLNLSIHDIAFVVAPVVVDVRQS